MPNSNEIHVEVSLGNETFGLMDGSTHTQRCATYKEVDDTRLSKDSCTANTLLIHMEQRHVNLLKPSGYFPYHKV